MPFEHIHSSILDLIPAKPCRVLDVGAGSGRDAAALARLGHEVLAVEPSSAMRSRAREIHSEQNIRWLDDALPDLPHVKQMATHFDFVLLSAVWMHMAPPERGRAFASLAEMMEEGGLLAMSLRMGAPNKRRSIYSVSVEQVLALGAKANLELVSTNRDTDSLGRLDVEWVTVVFHRHPAE